jgi:hypothetical protein
MHGRKLVRKGDTFPEPTPEDPNPDPFLTALGKCFLRDTGVTKPRVTAWVYCRCSCGRRGKSMRKLYEVCRIRRNTKTGRPNTRSCGCFREKTIKENNRRLLDWQAEQPSKWPLKRLRTKRILKHVDICDERADDVTIKQTDLIKVRCRKCGKESSKPAVAVERNPQACERCSGKEQWTLGRVREAMKGKCVLLNEDGSEDLRPDDTKVRLSDERYFRCLHCKHIGRPKKIFGQVTYKDSVCSECHSRKQWKLGRFRQLVASLGGKVRGLRSKPDDHLIKVRQKIGVACPFGHTDSKSPAHVQSQGTLCKECSTGLYERIVRAHFEAIFGVKFPNSSPDWLKNNRTTRPLELDGYAEGLKVAFEHDGPQHYGQRIRSNQTPESLKNIRRLHLLKDQLCRRNKVKLIRIVSMNRIASSDSLRRTILKKCKAAGIRVPNPTAIEKVTDAPDSIKIWQDIRTRVAERGGRLLTRHYAGSRTSLRVACGNKLHPPFTTTPTHLKRGQWCRKCYDLSLLNKGAVARGYKDNEHWLSEVLRQSCCKLLSRLPRNLSLRTEGIVLKCKCGKKQKPKVFASIVYSKTGGLCDSCKQKR